MACSKTHIFSKQGVKNVVKELGFYSMQGVQDVVEKAGFYTSAGHHTF